MSIFNPIELQAMDQLLHILWAFSVLGLLWGLRRWALGWAAAAILMDMPREFVDQWPIHWDSDWWIDLCFFGAGGIAAFYAFQRARSWLRPAVALGSAAIVLLVVCAAEAHLAGTAASDCQKRTYAIPGLQPQVDRYSHTCLVRTRTSAWMPIEEYLQGEDLERRRRW